MKLLRISDLVDITGLGKSTIYKEISEGRFPKPIKIAERTSVWTETDITSWLNSKIRVHNNAEGDNREYIFQLEDTPSRDEIFKFIDDTMDRLIEMTEDRMATIRQTLFLERAKLIEEAAEFVYGKPAHGHKHPAGLNQE